jgi:rfaE bifunctional protein nucleotidyltransferase chain/domain
MSTNKKIIPFLEASAIFERLRAEGKRLVQCHGTFDLIHPGHIYHLEEAKDFGDVLVATVTAEKHVNKGPGRPYFNDALRAKNLAALSCVDYVVVVPYQAAVEAIECVKPHIYCKGREYEDPTVDVTGNIHDDVQTVQRFGGQVRYIGSIVFSSSKLLNRHFDNVPVQVKEYCRELACEVSADAFREAVESFADLKVLVVGDIIFDRYSYVRVQGLTSKNQILSTRFLNEETQAGGALAVHRHLRNFCNHVHLIGLVGKESWLESLLRNYIAEDDDLCLREEHFSTVVKQRFVEPLREGKELTKLFSVNLIDADPPCRKVEETLLATMNRIIRDYDIILVADFGHGVMSERMRRLVEEQASFMALNCQTNSNNHGFNIISRQYKRCDCFSLDEQELLLSSACRHVDYIEELGKLRRSLGAKHAWLTRGGTETIGLQDGKEPSLLIPLESKIVDTVGAGDAFYSVAALSAKLGFPINLSTLIGQLAGAQSIRIVGNTEPISKQALLKSGMTLLSF